MRQTSCAIFDCTTPQTPRPVASFSLDDAGDGYPGYGKRHIDQPDAFALDPAHLPLTSAIQLVRRRRDGSFGALSDAGPNAWGMKLTSSINRYYARSQCMRFLLREQEARQLIDQVKTEVSQWRTVFADAGITKTDIQTLGSCFTQAESADRVQVVGADIGQA